MKILFAADLHGKIRLYEEMFDIAIDEDVDVILLGGDLFPTRLGSLVHLITGTLDFNVSLKNQYTFIDSYLRPSIDKFKEKMPSTQILYIPGNHDWEVTIEYLMRNKNVTYIHGRSVEIEGITFTGYGCVTDSFFWVKDFVRRDTPSEKISIESRYPCLSSAAGITISNDTEYLTERPSIEEELRDIKIGDPSSTVCMFHDPPFDTGLDTLFNGKPIGSKAIRRFIEEKKPLVSLHGHIHEAPYVSEQYWTRLGNTLCINPGHDRDILHAVILDTDDPYGSLYHSVFGRSRPAKPWLKATAERYLRYVKSKAGNMILSKHAYS